jgi:hypothetical protein
MKLICFLILLASCLQSFSQNKNSVWCFGDHCLIDYSDTANVLVDSCALNSRGTAASISDGSGHLIFYSGYDADQYTSGGSPDYSGEVYNRNHQLMLNGDGLVTELWYNEQAIVPDPSDTNLFYIFHTSVLGVLGLYYSKVDMTLNGGLGDVTQKNIQLLNLKACDCLTAIKHGNGRDWWVIFKTNDTPNNNFYVFLVDPSGISGPFVQSIGSVITTNIVNLTFNVAGNFLVQSIYDGLIETFDFDRCTGVLSNHQLLFSIGSTAPFLAFWSTAISVNDRYLYVSTSGDTTYLMQLDLFAPNPWQTRDTIWIESSIQYGGGELKLAPNGKIYFATAWNDSGNWNFPYPDTAFNVINNNLGVINFPDSASAACGFTPYSFNLGSGRCYWGLPNNPDYELGPVVGSVCDSLHVGISPTTLKSEAVLHTYYHSGWQMAFVNASGLQGRKCLLTITDVTGRIVYKEESQITNGYFTSDIRCENFASGVYIVSLSTEKEKLGRKFVKE